MPSVDRHRCSAFTRQAGLDPVGSAGSYRGFVLVEVPLPWPAEITEHPMLSGATVPAGWRVQGLVPAARDQTEWRVVTFAGSGDDPFSGYRRSEVAVPTGEQGAVLDAIGDGPPAAPGPDAASPTTTDVLVCTHGSRDICCGSAGPRVAAALVQRWTGGRVWRTSHTGGHRYAPTAITLPDGHLWAWADDDVLASVVDRTIDPAAAARHYRGCTGAPSAAAQVVEREAFVRHGWDWFGYSRTYARDDTAGADATSVRIDYVAPDGTSGTHDGTARITREFPILACGQPVEAATKTCVEWEIASFA